MRWKRTLWAAQRVRKVSLLVDSSPMILMNCLSCGLRPASERSIAAMSSTVSLKASDVAWDHSPPTQLQRSLVGDGDLPTRGCSREHLHGDVVGGAGVGRNLSVADVVRRLRQSALR